MFHKLFESDIITYVPDTKGWLNNKRHIKKHSFMLRFCAIVGYTHSKEAPVNGRLLLALIC